MSKEKLLINFLKCPARVSSMADLPPAWIGVGVLDLFVEEDMEYGRRLVHARVATELHVESGAFHGFDILVPDAEVSRKFSASWKSALRKAFATGKPDKQIRSDSKEPNNEKNYRT